MPRPYDTSVPTTTVDDAPTPPAAVRPTPSAVDAAKRASAAAASSAQPVRVLSGEQRQLVFVQATPATLWSVRHQLGRYPTVTVMSALGEVFHGAVRHRDVGWTEIEFSEPVSGKAVLT